MSLARDITTVGGGTLVSRLLAYFRDAAIAALLGAGPFAEAFFAVLQMVNFFRRLLAEGALNAAFVPIWLKLRGGADGGQGHLIVGQQAALERGSGSRRPRHAVERALEALGHEVGEGAGEVEEELGTQRRRRLPRRGARRPGSGGHRRAQSSFARVWRPGR